MLNFKCDGYHDCGPGDLSDEAQCEQGILHLFFVQLSRSMEQC